MNFNLSKIMKKMKKKIRKSGIRQLSNLGWAKKLMIATMNLFKKSSYFLWGTISRK